MTAIVLLALLGLAVGSFLNLCCDRLPHGRSIVTPASHCEKCQRRLGFADLLPLFSYLWLRGRCRHCGTHISLRVPAVEIATALLFALLTWKYGLDPQLPMALVYACVFLIVFVTDLEHGLVLDVVVYPAVALAFVFSFFWPGLGWPSPGVLSALLGGAIGFSLLLVPYLVSRGGMGGGDVKLAGLIGLATGFPHVFLALAIAIVAAGLLAIALLALRRKTRKQAIPFGPFLAVAAMVTIVWGQPISAWILRLMSG
jgi:leader peptidase (prepilin peptidase)/N-methyltransferase